MLLRYWAVKINIRTQFAAQTIKNRYHKQKNKYYLSLQHKAEFAVQTRRSNLNGKSTDEAANSCNCC